jgi:hypothetical protein
VTDPLKVSEAAYTAFYDAFMAATEDLPDDARDGVVAGFAAALPVLVAEGWVPPEQLEQVGMAIQIPGGTPWSFTRNPNDLPYATPVFRVVRDGP